MTDPVSDDVAVVRAALLLFRGTAVDDALASLARIAIAEGYGEAERASLQARLKTAEAAYSRLHDRLVAMMGERDALRADAERLAEAAQEVDDLIPTLRAFIDADVFHAAAVNLHAALAAHEGQGK